MNKEILEKYQLEPKKIRYKKSVQIIEDQENNKYIIKKNQKKNPNIYRYLMNRNFYNFPEVYTTPNDALEVTKYIEDILLDPAQRIEDMIYLLSILHNKTTFYKEIDLDEIKKIYEDTSDEYNYLLSYYQSIQSMIEEEVYMSPAHYYFILNITKVYNLLSIGRQHLENWYNLVNQRKTLRFVLNHNHLSLDHFLESKELYFISWNSAEIGFPSQDLVNLFQENYENIDFQTMMNLYQSKYKLMDEEYSLLVAQICKLKRLDFNQSETKKIEEVTKFNSYTQKLYSYFLKQNSSKTNNYP